MNILVWGMYCGYFGAMFWAIMSIALFYRINKESDTLLDNKQYSEKDWYQVSRMQLSADYFTGLTFMHMWMGGICHVLHLATLFTSGG